MKKRRALSSFKVNLTKLKNNFNQLRKLSKSKVIFMVKANAYGHGLSKVVNYCEQEDLCSDFGVASIDELSQLKSLEKSSFWVFSEVDLENNIDLYKKGNVIPVLSNIEDLKFYLTNISKSNICIKLDTGMNRLGFKESELNSVFDILSSQKVKKVKHLMTHFSSSYFEITRESKVMSQWKLFNRMVETFRSKSIKVEETSCSNSGSIEQDFKDESTHIRPGLMMYGLSANEIFNEKKDRGFKVLSSLVTRAVSLNYYEAGTEIGYGNKVLKRSGWIAVIPLGYADGILVNYSGAKVYSNNQEGYIWGRTNMDMAFVYFKERPQNEEITIWSDNLGEFCSQVRSIPYQVLTTISQRVPKVYEF